MRHGIGAQASLMVPVNSDSKPKGAVHLYYVSPPDTPPSSEQKKQIAELGLSALVKVAESMDKGDFDHIYEVVRQACEVAHADWCDLSLFKDEVLDVCIRVGTGVWLETPQPSIELQQCPDLLEALRSQRPLNQHVASESITEGGQTLLRTTYGQAVLALPLIQRGQTQGMVLFADTRTNRVFSEREIALGRAITGQAAMALENAHLVHDLEQSLAELHATQDRLVHTARLSAMGELAAVVAHQINNPLTTIVVDAELMLQDEPTDSHNYASLEAIERAGKRAAGVARRLLSIARSDDSEPSTESIDVIDTLTGVLALTKTHIEHNEIEFVLQLPSEPVPPVRSMRGQLEDVWLNLLLNARDALIGQAGARIGLEAIYLAAQQEIKVVIWDNGPGIPADRLEGIFEPFYTTKPPGEGTGLGLHICRQVVQRVGGRIEVDSKIGAGTRFTVYLPVVPVQSREVETPDGLQ